MHEPPPSESRNGPRKRVLKGGIIAFSGRHATLPCVVRDMSVAGARLHVDNPATVPDTFELLIELDGFEASCMVAWRRGSEIGVIFVSTPAKVAPKRVQVVNVTAPTNKPSLRRWPTSQASMTLAPAAVERVAAAPIATPVAAAITANPEVTIPILIVDDDPDDRLMIEDAFREAQVQHPVAFVENGEEMLNYLRAEGPYQNRSLPGLILLDLNMPRMDGRTALMHLKTNSALRRIPVMILTTSNEEDDIARTYDLGISGYIVKPRTFAGLVEIVQALSNSWLRIVSMPKPAG